MDPIKLIFSGDFAPIIPVDKITDNHFSGLKEIFDSADLHITNLEAPLTNSQIPIDKTGPSIKVDPAAIFLLKQAGVDIACLANNHIFDYGEIGIEDTIKTCSKNNIDTCGIISRKDGKTSWTIKLIKDKKIGFLNYCEHEFSIRGKGLTGACGYDPVDAYYDVLNLKPQVDYLIAIYHGGNEYYPLPRPDLKRDFHYLADLGADAVIGHHTHVFSGYEVYNGKPLIYSLGNFFFPYADEPESWHQGLLFILEIDEKLNFKLTHFIQCRDGISLHFPQDKEEMLLSNRFNELSAIIADDEELNQHWKDYVDNNGSGLRSKLLFSNKAHKLLAKSGILKPDLNRARSIENIIKCSSLRNLLLDSFKYYR